MNVSHVSIPITKVISLTFKNCTGLTNVYISDSDIVEIHNSIHTAQVKGDAQVSYYIETPNYVVTQGNAEIQTTSTLTLKP